MSVKGPPRKLRLWLSLEKPPANGYLLGDMWEIPKFAEWKKWILFHKIELLFQWRYNECDAVSNHRRLACLLIRLYRRRSKETSKLGATGLCEGIHRRPVVSLAKGQ